MEKIFLVMALNIFPGLIGIDVISYFGPVTKSMPEFYKWVLLQSLKEHELFKSRPPFREHWKLKLVDNVIGGGEFAQKGKARDT